MYCKNCGHELEPNVHFCGECGRAIINLNPEEKLTEELQQLDNSFEFRRHKSLGRVNISIIISKVEVRNQMMNVIQEKRYLYFIKKKVEYNLPLNQIKSLYIKRTIDISDLIFGLIFCILGFFNFLNFIPGILLLWIGFGCKIEIYDLQNNKILIPAEFMQPCNEFVEIIKNIRGN